jgi:hypothetical protein
LVSLFKEKIMGNLKRTASCVALLAAAMALSACNADVSGQGMMGGAGWGEHAFRSNDVVAHWQVSMKVNFALGE